MKHKLIIKRADGEIITGQELKEILVLVNFDIAPIASPPTKPANIIYPLGIKKYDKVTGVIVPVWETYLALSAEWASLYNSEITRFQAEQAQAEQKLKDTFDGIISYTKTAETDSKGRAIWKWLPATTYNYYQCMLILTGANRPSNVIDFICFSNFGS